MLRMGPQQLVSNPAQAHMNTACTRPPAAGTSFASPLIDAPRLPCHNLLLDRLQIFDQLIVNDPFSQTHP
jgi:hypothetical protein